MSTSMAPDKQLLLKLEDLRVHFPIHGGLMLRKVAEVKAVDGVSFELKRGETLGLVGESGCGKTTVGRAIVNILHSGSPDVEVYGKILYNHHADGWVDFASLKRKGMRKYRSDIQMIFQDPFSSLNPRMLVRDIIAEPLQITQPDMKTSDVDERVFWLLEKVGLSRDVSIQAQVINLLQDLQEEFSLTYIFIAHDLSVVEHISDRIAVMYLGCMVELGKAQDIYRNPKHPYTKALLEAVPLPDPDRVKTKDRKLLQGDVPNPIAKPSGCAFRTRCPVARPECARDVPEYRTLADGRQVACPYVD
jgi:oligopeptide transport system ATP-binding protein